MCIISLKPYEGDIVTVISLVRKLRRQAVKQMEEAERFFFLAYLFFN